MCYKEGMTKPPRSSNAMHVAKICTVKGDKVYESFLIRRSYREDCKVKHENVANITHLPTNVIELIRLALRGEPVSPVSESFEIIASHHHGHIQAVLTAMKRLGMAELLSSRAGRERDLVLAMVVASLDNSQAPAAPPCSAAVWSQIMA